MPSTGVSNRKRFLRFRKKSASTGNMQLETGLLMSKKKKISFRKALSKRLKKLSKQKSTTSNISLRTISTVASMDSEEAIVSPCSSRTLISTSFDFDEEMLSQEIEVVVRDHSYDLSKIVNEVLVYDLVDEEPEELDLEELEYLIDYEIPEMEWNDQEALAMMMVGSFVAYQLCSR